jgi:hypothetical protein
MTNTELALLLVTNTRWRRGRDGKTSGAGCSRDRSHLVAGGINHVHCPLGIVRDVGGASVQRKQDVFGLVPADKDIGDDLIGCRINDGDVGAQLMYEEESSAIRGDRALLRSGLGAQRDRGGGCERDRIENRHRSGYPVGNVGLQPIR